MKFSVVIPAYDKFHLTNDLLMDLYQNCQFLDEVLVVDNGSVEQETQDGFQFWGRVQPFNLKVLRLEENIGFLRAANYGLQQASGDIVALISNDVRVHKDIQRITREIMEAHGRKFLLGGRLYTDTTGWNCFEGRIFPYVEGWSLIATREAWEEFGYFDERYAPSDFEDVDISTTAVSKGYTLMQFPVWYGGVFEHIGAQTIGYNEERLKITERNRELFREKWI